MNNCICKKCRQCKNAYMKEYREKNKEKLKEYKKKYRKTEIYKKQKARKRKLDKDNLNRHYIYVQLWKKGFKNEDINEELIQVQKLIIKTKRLCKT